MKKFNFLIKIWMACVMVMTACSDLNEQVEQLVVQDKQVTALINPDDTIAVETRTVEYTNVQTIVLTTHGTLKKLLGENLTTADKLIISGPIDATDVDVFRNQMTALKAIDMTNVTFVESDSTYTYDSRYGYVASLKVGVIPDAMFSGKTNFVEIKLPKEVIHLEGRTFENCTSLQTIELPEGLESLGDWYAFHNCSSLSSIVIPEKIEVIPRHCFARCYSLKTVTLPENLYGIKSYAFQNCGALYSIVFPQKLAYIDAYAFEDCGSLESITLPSSLNIWYDSDYAFKNCYKLSTIILEEGLTALGTNMFYNCTALKQIEIPSTVKEIPNGFLYGCKALEKVVINQGVEIIGNNAFALCQSLTAIELPENLVKIGDFAFGSCTSLATVKLPETLLEIGNSAFMSCTSFTIIDFLPNSLTKIGDSAFSRIDNLTTVILPNSLETLGSSVFQDCPNLKHVTMSKNLKELGSSAFGGTTIETITLPETLTALGASAFSHCKSLKEIKIPELVTVIPKCCFEFCSNLASVTLPDGITHIEELAFYECHALTNVKLPASLTFMGYASFCNCLNLTLASPQLPESLTAMGERVFHNDGAITELVFPAGLSKIAKETCWNCYALKRVVISEGTTTISDSAFKNAHALTDASITLPSTLISIGSYAFENTAIANMDFLPEGLQTINYYVFKGCKLGKVLRFPSTLTTLANYALDGQSSTVAAIYLPATSGSVTVGNIFGITPRNGIGTSNCLIYTEGNVTSDATLPNVITNNTCLSLVLAEGTPFHCPEAFTAGKVTFKKQFNQKNNYNLYSTKGKASHWYGLSLPFTVTEITTADGRTFAPFNSDVEGANPFWLRRPSSSGFENVTRIEAGEPYIIAFPCNESYDDVYNVWGDVTFTGKNVTIPVTEEYQINGEYYTMKRNYELKEESGSMYLLNSPRSGYYDSNSGYYDSLNPQGRIGNSSYGWGSRFVPSLRQSWAFEAYLSAGITTSYFSVSPESASRSVRTLGAVPQIDDM